MHMRNIVDEWYKCYCGQRTAGGTGTGYRDISSNVSIVDPPSANTRHSFLSPNPINLPILTLYRGLSRHTARHATMHCSALQLWHRCIFINIHNIWKRKVLAKVQVETFCFNLKFALALYIDVKIEELWWVPGLCIPNCGCNGKVGALNGMCNVYKSWNF